MIPLAFFAGTGYFFFFMSVQTFYQTVSEHIQLSIGSWRTHNRSCKTKEPDPHRLTGERHKYGLSLCINCSKNALDSISSYHAITAGLLLKKKRGKSSPIYLRQSK